MSDYYPKLVFPGLTDQDLDYLLAYTPYKEWCGAAAAQLSEEEVYPVHFITPLRAAQDMEIPTEPVIESGLLVVPDTELVTMEDAIKEAAQQGFFASLKPITMRLDVPSSDAITSDEYPVLVFPSVAAEELERVLCFIALAEQCDLAAVKTGQGQIYPISFMTPFYCEHRLKNGSIVVSDGLILVPDTKLETMEDAVRKAYKEDFFCALKQVSQ